MKRVDYLNVDITGGFWKARQELNAKTTARAIWDRFTDTGRFKSLEFNWKEGDPNKPHIFWDSDIAKWIEAAAYILAKKEDAFLLESAEGLIDLIINNQGDDGYFNIYFTVVEPQERFKRRTDHELYCAGHLFEAAVAYNEATGRRRFLDAMCRYADYIEHVFVKERSAAFTTPGHEEIELALVRLYHATGERRYLELSRFFIDMRGTGVDDAFYDFANMKYTQDQAPVREQNDAEGHSVRALYLYSGMADIALETGDEAMKAACRRLFESIAFRRMYITGGVGSSPAGEAFTIDYDLPNATAYTESCAAIALAMFASRMSLLDADGTYADICELALYNGFLSSVSLDGKSFFYENPLEIDPRLHHRDVSVSSKAIRYPITQRVEVFDCSCCPPNIARFIASIGGSAYSHTGDTIYAQHYIESSASVELDGGRAVISMTTAYPADGCVALEAESDAPFTLALRVPGWCDEYELKCVSTALKTEKGYIYINLPAGKSCVELLMRMDAVLMEADPRVQEDSGRVALMRGPIVYCLESVDNGSNLRDIAVKLPLECKTTDAGEYNVPTIKCVGSRRNSDAFGGALYRHYVNDRAPVELSFIPYFAFANRGEAEMIVWTLTD